MTSIDPRGPGRAGGEQPGRIPRSGEDRRRSLARSTLWSDAEVGGGAPVGPQPLRARWDPVPPPRQRVSAARQPAPDLRTPPRQPRRRRTRRRSALGWFVHHYGWRAYAIPVLAALTVVAVIGLINSPGSDASDSAADSAPAGTKSTSTVTVQEESTETVTVTQSGTLTTIVQTVGGGDGTGAPAGPAIAATTPAVPSIDPDKAFRGVVMGVLPPGAAFAKTGAGTFHVIPGTSQRIGESGTLRRFTIEVEDGITTPQADEEFADAVVEVLSGPGSWAAGSDFSLQRIDSGTPDFRVSLTSQMTTRQAGYCGWDVQLEASCYNQAIGRVVINVARWVRGAYSYGDDMTSYREYAINHEVGHALGFHHEACPKQNGVAPVMMQQSWSTADDDIAALNPDTAIPADGKVCRANPFPYPDKVR